MADQVPVRFRKGKEKRVQGQLSQGHCNLLMSLRPEPRSLTPHPVLILKGKGQYFLTVAPRSEMPGPDDVCS